MNKNLPFSYFWPAGGNVHASTSCDLENRKSKRELKIHIICSTVKSEIWVETAAFMQFGHKKLTVGTSVLSVTVFRDAVFYFYPSQNKDGILTPGNVATFGISPQINFYSHQLNLHF